MSSNDAGIQDIERSIHEPSRLMIMVQLQVVQSVELLCLQRQTGMTPGNLSANLNKLEDAGYVEIAEEFIERKQHTVLALTKKGRAAFKEYAKKVKKFVDKLPE